MNIKNKKFNFTYGGYVYIVCEDFGYSSEPFEPLITIDKVFFNYKLAKQYIEEKNYTYLYRRVSPPYFIIKRRVIYDE